MNLNNTWKNVVVVVAVMLVCVCVASEAKADLIYAYGGQTMYNTPPPSGCPDEYNLCLTVVNVGRTEELQTWACGYIPNGSGGCTSSPGNSQQDFTIITGVYFSWVSGGNTYYPATMSGTPTKVEMTTSPGSSDFLLSGSEYQWSAGGCLDISGSDEAPNGGTVIKNSSCDGDYSQDWWGPTNTGFPIYDYNKVNCLKQDGSIAFTSGSTCDSFVFNGGNQIVDSTTGDCIGLVDIFGTWVVAPVTCGASDDTWYVAYASSGYMYIVSNARNGVLQWTGSQVSFEPVSTSTSQYWTN